MTDPFSPFRSTVDQVLDQYDLTPHQRRAVEARIDRSCPWFSRILYMRAHHAAATYLKETN